MSWPCISRHKDGWTKNPLYFLSVFELHKPLMQPPVSGLACSKEEVVQNDLVKNFSCILWWLSTVKMLVCWVLFYLTSQFAVVMLDDVTI